MEGADKDLHSKIIKEQVIYEGRFLGMKYVDYTIGEQTVNNYEKIFRTTNKKNIVEGIDIIPIIKYAHKKPQLLLNIQFRAPVQAYTLAFPTGMTEDENYEQNAKREMLEETGYLIEKIEKTPLPVLYYDPWKSDQNTYVFIATINGDDEKSFKGQSLEHDEDIKTVKFEINDKLLQNVVDYCNTHKLKLESKVYTAALGIWFRYNLASI